MTVKHLAPAEAVVSTAYSCLEQRQDIRRGRRNSKILSSNKYNWLSFTDGGDKEFCCKFLHVLRVPFGEFGVWQCALPCSVGYETVWHLTEQRMCLPDMDERPLEYSGCESGRRRPFTTTVTNVLFALKAPTLPLRGHILHPLLQQQCHLFCVELEALAIGDSLG